MSLQNRILLSRLLTRSGDQAWDFAVPLMLLHIYPGQIRFAAMYYLIVRLASVILLPSLASKIDRIDRQTAAKLGIFLQLIGVLAGSLAVLSLAGFGSIIPSGSAQSVILVATLSATGILASLGSGFMDISVANDLVPAAFSKHELAEVNARLRRVDLFTEVGAPVLAGFLLLIKAKSLPLLGFYLVALWNVASFFPEFLLLVSVFKEKPELKEKARYLPMSAPKSLIRKLTEGWISFFREPVAPSVIAYSLLWLSVLSPHGVLLTGYLKDEWQVPEWQLGIFRAGGALFGLAATFIYPNVIAAVGLLRGSRIFLRMQAVFVVLALACFLAVGPWQKIGFLTFILLSRIALYGFSLGEIQIRQRWIPEGERGRVNGFASAVTGLATLFLYGAGSALPETKDFSSLIFFSVAAVLSATLIFGLWSRRFSMGQSSDV